MSEDRAFVANMPGGYIRWVILWATGATDWMFPHEGPLEDASKEQREWMRLWAKESKRIATTRLHGLREHAKTEDSDGD